MKELLGINSFLLGGLILLILSIGIIIFGLKSQMPEKLYFNISRLLALLSVAGIWYFGNILTKNTEKEISSNKLKTAEAISKTKDVELKLSKANTELQTAKKETEDLKLEIANTNLELENTKERTAELNLELIRTKEKAKSAEKERSKLIELQKYIKSIAMEIKFKYSTTKTKPSIYTPSLANAFQIISTSGIVTPNKDTYIYFTLTNFAQHQIDENSKEITLNYAFSQKQNEIIGKRLEELNGELYINCNWNKDVINHLSNYLTGGNIDYEITIIVNGIKSLNHKTNRLKSGSFESANIQFYIEDSSNKIVEKLLGQLTEN